MRRSTPFFKFDAAAWLSGTIRGFPLEYQAVFLTACAIVWRAEAVYYGDLASLARRIDPLRSQDPAALALVTTALQELAAAGLLQVSDAKTITVKFLTEQAREIGQYREEQQRRAMKRWSARAVATAVRTDAIVEQMPAENTARIAYESAGAAVIAACDAAGEIMEQVEIERLRAKLRTRYGRSPLPGRTKPAIEEGITAALAKWGSKRDASA